MFALYLFSAMFLHILLLLCTYVLFSAMIFREEIALEYHHILLYLSHSYLLRKIYLYQERGFVVADGFTGACCCLSNHSYEICGSRDASALTIIICAKVGVRSSS